MLSDLEIRHVAALRAIEGGLLRLKWLGAATRFEIAMHRHMRALKYGYNPAQPRVPRGDPDGGQWTDGDANGNPVARSRTRLAGDTPTNDPPQVPKEMPPSTRSANKVIKTVAQWMGRNGGTLGKIVQAGSWIYEAYPYINAYLDPPKELSELQSAVEAPARGYDIHHVVEQTQAERDGYPRSAIDGPDNLVRIPTLKHWQLTGWYMTPNEDYGGMSPRAYLQDKSWEERTRVGLEALAKVGVLKR